MRIGLPSRAVATQSGFRACGWTPARLVRSLPDWRAGALSTFRHRRARARVLFLIGVLLTSVLLVGIEPAEVALADTFPMKMPTWGRVSSKFGGGCPVRRVHAGIDIEGVPVGVPGTDVLAAYSGVVAYHSGSGYGNYL